MAEWQNRIIETRNMNPADLKPHPKNWRKHPGSQQRALQGVLDDVGWVGQVIFNQQTGLLLDGHLRVDMAIRKKEKTLPVNIVDLTPEEELKILATFDPIAAMAETDKDLLAEVLGCTESDNQMVTDLMTNIQKENKILLEDAGEEKEAPAPKTERAGELKTKWETATGQIWKLGMHRIICGDSTDPATIERLMAGTTATITFTSPPYNTGSLNMKGKARTQPKYISIADTLKPDEYNAFLKAFTDIALDVSQYVFVNLQILAQNKQSVIQYLGQYQDLFKDMMYWVKSNGTPNIHPGVMTSRAELIIILENTINPTRTFETATFSQGNFGNVIEGASNSGNNYSDIHKAVFPEYLPKTVIENFVPVEGSVFDPFLGTGTTLIAGEQLGRRVFGCELSPEYTAVVLDRWQTMTGKDPVLLE